MPPERVAILRQAFAALAHDAEFLADAEKSKIEFDFLPSEEIDKIVAQIAVTPADVTDPAQPDRTTIDAEIARLRDCDDSPRRHQPLAGG